MIRISAADRITVMKRAQKRTLLASPGLFSDIFLATVRESAVWIPDVLTDRQRAYTGKTS